MYFGASRLGLTTPSLLGTYWNSPIDQIDAPFDDPGQPRFGGEAETPLDESRLDTAGDRWTAGAAISTVNNLNGQAYLYSTTNNAVISTKVGENSNDRFGSSVALNSTHWAVSAQNFNTAISLSGKVYIYTSNDGTAVTTLLNPIQDIGTRRFGAHMVMNEDYLAVSAIIGTNPKVFIFQTSDWTLFRTIDYPGPTANSQFGRHLAINDLNQIAIGAYSEDSLTNTAVGAVYLFDIATGTQLHKFTPVNDYLDNHHFGRRIVMDSEYIAIATSGGVRPPLSTIPVVHTGLYELSTYSTVANWEVLDTTNTDEVQSLGSDMDIKDGKLFIGQHRWNDGLERLGRVCVFELNRVTGVQTPSVIEDDEGLLAIIISPVRGSDPNNPGTGYIDINPEFGSAVAIADNLNLYVGAQGVDSPAAFGVPPTHQEIGRIYVMK